MKIKKQFDDILQMIKVAKQQALLVVNTELIGLYWNIGRYISNKIACSDWGKSVVKNLSEYIFQKEPEIKGFSSQNLWRMKQFYETYSENTKLSALVREISWTNNLAMVAKYETELIDKKLLEKKLDEFFQIANKEDTEE